MAKIEEKDYTRTFTLEVTEEELRLLERGLHSDKTGREGADATSDDNYALWVEVSDYMEDEGIDPLPRYTN